MVRKALLRTVLVPIAALGLYVGCTPAYANTSTIAPAISALPSSDETLSRNWLRMNPTTFTATNAAVHEQYDRAAKLDPRLTTEKRARLALMLQGRQGVQVMVPDGIGLDYLTGRFEGSPFVYTGMVKKLGREDRALMFDLGDGVTIYWFTGARGVSCNNIGIVIKRPPSPFGMAPPPPKPHKVVCQTVYAQKQQQPPEGTFISSLYLPNCCCEVLYTPSLYLSGGQASTMTIGYQVCS